MSPRNGKTAPEIIGNLLEYLVIVILVILLLISSVVWVGGQVWEILILVTRRVKRYYEARA